MASRIVCLNVGVGLLNFGIGKTVEFKSMNASDIIDAMYDGNSETSPSTIQRDQKLRGTFLTR